MIYQPVYTPHFQKRCQTLHSLRHRIEKIVERILKNPYTGAEQLGKKGGLNLKGCRSARVGRNFRIIFVICEECRQEPECEYCACEGLPDKTVVFLTVGPHEKAYAMK